MSQQPTPTTPLAAHLSSSAPVVTTTPPASSLSAATTAPSSLSTASSDDPLGFVWDLKANPCFRSSLMWGIGLGGALGIHAFTRHRLPYKASDTAVKAFFAVSSVSWLWCRHAARKEKELFDAFINLELSNRQSKPEQATDDAAALQSQSAPNSSTAHTT